MFSNEELIEAALKSGAITSIEAIELSKFTSESVLLYELFKKTECRYNPDSHAARLKTLAYQNRNPHLNYEQSMIAVADFI